jgi:predicted nucleic acid-binding Zn ribbon protein
MGDAPPEKCEVCGEGPLERVLYPVAVHFKGSGFYSTDYGRGSRKSKDGGGADSESGAPKESDSKTESKTETKAAEPS